MTMTETREEKLHRLLAEVVDTVYGTDYHDIGDGDGMSKELTEEITMECRAYWNKKHGAFPQYFTREDANDPNN